MTIDNSKFNTLKEKWLREVQNTAPTGSKADSYTPAYYEIIGLHDDAIPCILQELIKEDKEPNDWFFALAMITHINPVPRELRGNKLEMSKKWIQWGYDKGHLVQNEALQNLKKEMAEKLTNKKK